MVHHDIWNYDTPTAPLLLDVTVDGREIKGVFQATKQAFVYALDRETGEPIWPIEERAVPQSSVPGEQLSATQPFPTNPAPYDLQGRTEEHLIDYTPELRRRALEVARAGGFFTPFFNPPVQVSNDPGARPVRVCPGGSGGANITGPPVADPVAGVIFITSHSGCGNYAIAPGVDSVLEGPNQRRARPWSTSLAPPLPVVVAAVRPAPTRRVSTTSLSGKDRSVGSARSI